MQITTLGIDLAKNVFCLRGCDAKGRAVLRKRLLRRQLLSFVANLPPCLVVRRQNLIRTKMSCAQCQRERCSRRIGRPWHPNMGWRVIVS
jgi:hypothetical protein